jgi:pimeloyl-ACP methyl ester carboxylesterase
MRFVRRSKWILGGLLTAALLIVAAFAVRPMEFISAITDLRLMISGARSHSVEVAGNRLHYYVMGPSSGEPVLLLHGLGGSAENWQNLAPYLQQAGYRVYLLDLLGYGKSDRPPNFSYTVLDQADVVLGVLNSLNLRQVDLGGWSMGGWIAQLVAARHPDRIRKLLLIDSGGVAFKPPWDPKIFTYSNVPELLQFAELVMSRTPPPMPTFMRNDMIRQMQQNAWIVDRALKSMLTFRDATDPVLPSLKMPVLIVWGSIDRLTPLEMGEITHRLIPGSQLLITQCGHLAPIECAPEIGPRVVMFLKD